MYKLSTYPKFLDTRQAERLIAQLAEESSRIYYTNHAQDRMEERNVSMQDIEKILRNGFCAEQPMRDEKGQWKCKLIRHHHGNRDVGVVTVILRSQALLIVTVEWEDI